MSRRPACCVYTMIACIAATIVGALPALAQFPIRASGCEWQRGFHTAGLGQDLSGAVFLSPILDAEVYDDGSGPALYYAGLFRTADEERTLGIAKWDGESWSAPPIAGLPFNSTVSSLAVWNDGSGPALYAAFSSGIGRWNGTSWSTLPSPVAGFGVGLLTSGNVAGSSRLFAQSSSTIYQWGGSSWTPISGEITGQLVTMTVWNDGSGGKLYAGGTFTQIGAVAAEHVAVWNGATWAPLGAGLSGTGVNTLVGIGSRLYAGGSFSNGVYANIAAWTGSTWTNLGGSVNGPVTRLAAFDAGSGSILAASGDFTLAGTGAADGLAIWTGTAWTALARPPDAGSGNLINSLIQYDDGGGNALFAAGKFRRDGGQTSTNVARWRAGSWSPVTAAPGGLGLDGEILAAGVQSAGAGRGLYVFGRNPVPGPGGLGGNYQQWLMKFDGSQWTRFATPNGTEVLKSYDDGTGPTPYAAIVTSFGLQGSTASILKWNGSAWTSIGSSRQIRVMEEFDDGNGKALYAAGKLLAAPLGPPSPNFASNIAKWDGSTWSALGVGIHQPILDLAVYDDGSGGGPALYAAGEFTEIGDRSPIPAGRIAKWDGSAWSPVGGAGLDGRVEAMAVWNDGGGDALYVVGQFANVGGLPAPGIAKWNGTAWSSVGGGATSISDIVVFDDGAGSALYVDGAFTTIGGQPIATTARWDGSAWTPVGSGPGPRGKMQVFDSGAGPALFFTGSFLEAGGLSAYNVAQYCRPGVFQDGFESGLPDAWSQVFP